MSSDPVFQLRALEKRHHDGFALRVPSLDIASGEVVVLLGPTGAGKSTLLRILAGLEAPTAGAVRLAGRLLTGAPLPLDVQRRMTMVFQRPLVLRGTVRTNVEYGMRIRHQRDARPKTEAMLQRIGLERLANQSAATLSGGQMHLVALARALLIEPDVLLLDEPTANLDPAHVALVERVVAEERHRRGMTVVWATHNLFQARRVADRLALLLDGDCVEVGTTDQFFSRPRDARTAAFVAGEMVY